MTNSNYSAYICKEVFDENSEPTRLEIEQQAFRLGIDLSKELHLLYIAEQCLHEPLPSNWLPCYIIKENKYFYYNTNSKTSQWEHPLDEHYRQIVEKTRSEDSSTGQDVSLNIILDEDNQFDTMYHTKNINYEKKTVGEKRTVRFKTPIEESLDLDYSDDNMKFLGPIKLNTPYTSTSSVLQNLPQFSATNTFDIARNAGSRSGLSKYNILPNKEEQHRKSDINENNKTLNDGQTLRTDYNIVGKENVRKIDITLTESSDQSDSTSYETHTENLHSDNEGNGLKKNNNVITSVQMNDQQERNDDFNDETRVSANDNFDKFQSTAETTHQAYNVKKDDVISDSGNSTAKDSKIIQSSMTTISSFSATKSKMAEITQRFPLNKFTNEIQLSKLNSPMENKKRFLDINNSNSKYDLKSDSNDEKHALLDTAQVTVIIERHIDLMQNKLENTIKTRENMFREDIIEQIDVIREQNRKFEKHIESRHNDFFTRSELKLNNMIQEKVEKLFIEKYEKKRVENISNVEQMYTDKLNMYQKDLENYTKLFKNEIQSKLDAMSNELLKEFNKNAQCITDSWNKTLQLYRNTELDKVKNDFEQTAEKIKCDTDTELHRFHQEFKEKLGVMSEVKLSNTTDQLVAALQNKIDSVKTQANKNCQDDVINMMIQASSTHKPQLNNSCTGSSEQDLYLSCLNVHKANCYGDIRKKIQHSSNELNDALKLINKMVATNEYVSREHCLCSNKCTVSCQTENVIITHLNPNLNKLTYPAESSNMSIFNNHYDINSKYADYWNQERTSRDICSDPVTCSQILSQEEMKVNAAEQNICRLIDTFNNLKQTDIYHYPINTNYIYQNKFNNIYQALTPKQIAYNRTKNLKEWLYKTDLRNKNL